MQNQTTSKADAQTQQSATMPGSALLWCLVLLAGAGASRDRSVPPKDSCAHLPASLPHMLRELRTAFGRVKTFFVSMVPPSPPRDRLNRAPGTVLPAHCHPCPPTIS